MNNKLLMKKVIELDTQTLRTREQSRRVMLQLCIIRKTFGVKNAETDKPVLDFERERVLSDQEVMKESEVYTGFYEYAIKKGDTDKMREFKTDVYNFIEAVQFFDSELAEQLKVSFEVKYKIAS